MEAISVPGPSRARLPFVASKRLGLNQRVIGSSRSERQGRTLSHAFRGQQGFNDRSQEFSGNIESIGCLRRAKRIGKKRLFANEIVCECVAIGVFEDEASGRRHEPKSERAREVRKSALMAVSLGPEEALRKTAISDVCFVSYARSDVLLGSPEPQHHEGRYCFLTQRRRDAEFSFCYFTAIRSRGGPSRRCS